VPNERDSAGVDIRQCAKIRQRRRCIVELAMLEQLQLDRIATCLTVRGHLAVHRVDRAFALIGRRSDAPPKQKQTEIAMACEHRSECFRLLLVGTELLQLLACSPASMIDQDGRKGTLAGRSPEMRLKRRIANSNRDHLRAILSGRHSGRQNERKRYEEPSRRKSLHLSLRGEIPTLEYGLFHSRSDQRSR
jgi:hypothetical protein